jgi:hypothetical protein
MSNNITRLYDWAKIHNNALFIVIISVLVLISSAFNVMHLTTRSLDLEEIFSISYSRKCSLAQLSIQKTCHDNGNPPFHFVALKLFQEGFGKNDYNARMLSVIFYSFSLIALFLVCHKSLQLSHVTTILVLLVYAYSSLIHYYAQTARPYSLLTLCCLVVFGCIVTYLRSSGKNRKLSLVVGAISMSIGFYTHYSFVVYILLLMCSACIVHFDKTSLKKIITFFALPILLFIPRVVLFITDQFFSVHNSSNRYDFWQLHTQWSTWEQWINILSNGLIQIYIPSSEPVYTYGVFYSVLFLAWAFFVYNFALYFISHNQSKRMLGILLVLTITVYFTTPLNKYFSLPRYMIFIVPFIYISFMGMLEKFSKPSHYVLLFLIPLFIMYANNSNYYSIAEDWRGVGHYLATQPQDGIIITDVKFLQEPIEYYYKKNMKIDCVIEISEYDDESCGSTINDLQGFSRVYYIGREPDAKIEKLFQSVSMRLAEKRKFTAIDIYIYSSY